MKILVVSKYFYPYLGGIESVVYYNAKYLVEKGHEVTVIASEHTKGLKKEESIDGIKVVRVPTWFTLSSTPISPRIFLEVLKRKFDICNLHEPTGWSSPMAFFPLILKRKPWVVTYHSDIVGRTGPVFGTLFWVYRKICQPFVLRYAKRVMPTSPQYVKISDTLPSIPEELITVIPNGVDINKFQPGKAKRSENEIFFQGRLIYYKGLDYLLQAMPPVLKNHPDAKLIIGGTGELKEELEKLAEKLEISKSVKFLGKTNDEQMIGHLQKCAVFVLPSVHKSEAFGIVILEAMACGAPVITTDISGTVYAAGDAGIIVPNKKVNELAEAIDKVLSSKTLREKMSEKSLKQAEKFQWKKIAEMTEKVYKEEIKN